MFVITRITVDIETGAILAREGFGYSGPVSLCCGASSSQQQIEQLQQQQYTTLIADEKAQFADATSIFNQLSAQFSPILAAGPNQQGYSPAEIAQLNSTAATGTGEEAATAKQALNQIVASQGGSSALPSGTALKAGVGVAEEAGQQLASEEMNTQVQSEEIGRQNWLNAASILGGATSSFGTANQAGGVTNQGGSAASTTANDIVQANQAAFNGITGAITGAAGSVGSIMGCPATGSLYLMADGSEKPAETLAIGEQIAGEDGESQTIDEINVTSQPVIQVYTENGFVTRNSITHCFVSPDSFVLAAKSLGNIVSTAKGQSKVVSVQFAGFDNVFDIVTKGSHSYRADGVWAYGVGHVASDEVAKDYLKALVKATAA